jgi:hypothetical protein
MSARVVFRGYVAVFLLFLEHSYVLFPNTGVKLSAQGVYQVWIFLSDFIEETTNGYTGLRHLVYIKNISTALHGRH